MPEIEMPQPLEKLCQLVSEYLEDEREHEDELLEVLEVLGDLGDLGDDSSFYIPPYNIEQIIDLGSSHYPLALAIITYVIDKVKIGTDDLCDFAKMCSPKCLNDKNLASKLIRQAVSNASSTTDYLCLDDYTRVGNGEAVIKYLLNAEHAVKDIGDAFLLMGQEPADKMVFTRLYEELKKNLYNKDYVDPSDPSPLSYTPVDFLNAALENGFIEENTYREYLKSLLSSSSPVLPFMKMLELIPDKKFEESRGACLDKAISMAQTPEEKFKIYEFIKENFKDGVRAEQYLDENHNEFSAILAEKEQNVKDFQLLDTICQCCLLVYGNFAEEEARELYNIRAYIKYFFHNRPAIEFLERTGDIETTRELRSDHEVEIEVHLTFPTYHQEMRECFHNLKSVEEYITLLKLYASKIEDPFAQRVTAWAVHQLVDVTEGEIIAQIIMAREWGLDLEENKLYFLGIVYPATKDDYEYLDPSRRNEQILENRELDQDDLELYQLVNDENYSELNFSLSEHLECNGVKSLAGAMAMQNWRENTSDSTKSSPLWEALLQLDSNMALDLCRKGADINETMDQNKVKNVSPLMLIAQHYDLNVLKEIIKLGADINAKTSMAENGEIHTPLKAAIMGNSLEKVQFLVESGAEINSFTSGETLHSSLSLAAGRGNLDVFNFLLSKDADVHWRDKKSSTILKIAVMAKSTEGQIPIIEKLIELGVDPNAPDDEGYFPIHNVVDSGNLEVARILIDAGALVDQPILAGEEVDRRPLLQAATGGWVDIFELLISKGADLNLLIPENQPFEIVDDDGHCKEGPNEEIDLLSAVLFHSLQDNGDFIDEDREEIITLLCDSGVVPTMYTLTVILLFEGEMDYKKLFFKIAEADLKHYLTADTIVPFLVLLRIHAKQFDCENRIVEMFKDLYTLLEDLDIDTDIYSDLKSFTG